MKIKIITYHLNCSRATDMLYDCNNAVRSLTFVDAKLRVDFA